MEPTVETTLEISKIIFWLLTSTLSGSFGAIYLKMAMDKMPSLSVKNIVKSKYFYLGGTLYILSAVTNIMLFKYLQYSVAFPMTSLSYVWTIFISYFIFKEKIDMKKIIAIFCIVVGVILLGIAE